MANTVINTPELLNLDSTTGATILAKGTVNERPPVQTFSVEYLAVAGGGGGGYQDGGGGGAGGFLTNTLSSINNGQSFTLTIGEGGAGGTKTPAVVNSGDNTIIAYGSTTITAIGGGGGSSDNNGAGGAADGGSGGGGASGSGTRTGGSGTPGQGNDGGDGNASNQGGGGGGAGAAGQNATSSGANGGIGLTTTIISTTNAATASVGEVSGSNLYFAGGGGGDNRTVFGSGGLGGGSNAAVNPINATANTGGGGGSAFGGSPATGGAGGSGVIILKYDSSVTLTKGSGLTEASGSPFTEGSYKVSVFTQGTGNVTLSTTLDALDAINGTLRFNTDTNKTEYYDGTGWYEIVDEYASGFIGPATNYFDTKLYTGNGATQSIGGYINGSASFNGSSSYIDLGTSLLGSRSAFSVSTWVNFSNLNTQNFIFFTSESGTGRNVGFYDYGNGNIYFQPDASTSANRGYISNSGIYTTDEWVHIVMVFDGSATGNSNRLKAYIQGTERTLTYDGTIPSSSGTSTANSWIGGRSSTKFSGDIDQVRIYNAALSASDVAALNLETAATATTAAFPSGQTAVATYTMDTSANGLLNTQDLSTVNYPAGAGCLALYEMNGNSNDTSGTYNGTPTNITYQGGAFDQAAVFNGSSSLIAIGNPIPNTDTDVSISAWVKLDSGISSNMHITGTGITSAGSEAPFRATLQYQSANTFRIFSLRQVAGTYYLSPNSSLTNVTINPNTWYHIVWSYTASGRLLNTFLNGVQIDTNVPMTTSGSSVNDSTTVIGSFRSTSGPFFDGSLDQVRIFNTALTQAQVTTLARGIATSYSGTNNNVNFNGHLNFAPGLVWLKSRDRGTTPYTGSHYWFDSIRGALQRIKSNDADPENTFSNSLTSFDTNGFSLGSGSNVNYNGDDFVAWNWKAGGAAVTNNDGTIASQVSANKDAGFSIVKYDGYQSSGTTCGHGLSSAPELIIAKNLNQTTSWPVWYDDAITTTSTTFTLEGSTKYLALNSTTGYIPYTFDRQFGGTLSGSSGDKMIAYCFHSVAGYSKIGSYTGNGSSTGPIVYTTDDGTSGGSNGFEPKFIMIKRTDTSGYGWYMMDSARGMVGTTGKFLFANTSASEGTLGAGGLQPNSTGFQITDAGAGFNANLGTYIYMAFA